MLYDDAHTRWNRKYAPRFYTKHAILNSKIDKDTIHYYSIQIANHTDPKNIGGVATCSDEIFKKLEFIDGWIIVYEVNVDTKLIEFVNFYRKRQ